MSEKNNSGEKIIVRQIRSGIGHPKNQKQTLSALGLGKIGRQKEHNLTPSVYGMLQAVSHLIFVEKV